VEKQKDRSVRLTAEASKKEQRGFRLSNRELAGLRFEEHVERFKVALPLLLGALRGRAEPPLAADPALADCAEHPIPAVIAAQSPGAVRRAAKLGVGVLYDSLQTAERMRRLSDAYAEAGGEAARIAIRRVWIGPPPQRHVERQMDFYRDYARPEAQQHWGEGEELIFAADGAELAERLGEFAARSGCDALNLRVHFLGVDPARVSEQVERLGAETLPSLRERLARRLAR
jgi:hypothetical protein